MVLGSISRSRGLFSRDGSREGPRTLDLTGAADKISTVEVLEKPDARHGLQATVNFNIPNENGLDIYVIHHFLTDKYSQFVSPSDNSDPRIIKQPMV